MLDIITIIICLLTITMCGYTLWKIKFISSNTVDNRQDIRALHEHDRQLISYIKQMNGELQNAKKSWSKIERTVNKQNQ